MGIVIKQTELERDRIASTFNRIRSEELDFIQKCYENACQENDFEIASHLARKIRNKLLDDSDKEMSIDRILPEITGEFSTQDVVKWIKSLHSFKKNAWGEYRQKLRDLPEQEGFPFDVEFPQKPE